MKITLQISDTSWSRAGYDEDGDPIFDAATLEEQVAAVFAQQLLAKFTPKITEWLRGFVEARCASAIETLVMETIMEPVQPTNTFGEPKGAPITLRELLKQQCQKAMEQKVYARLDPRTGKVEIAAHGYRRDGFQEMTAWQAQVYAAANEGVPAVLNGAITDAVNALRTQVKGQAATAFAKGVQDLLGIP